ncbi:hypothetical protein [Nocardiopsis sp. CNR-923]|uniref:hypothetical protein n=1 Tax=Nocardiopsis sp. CNR-923 TaxID=1904965 RepID=UPI00373FD165
MTQETSPTPATGPTDPADAPRYRLERAGIRNVWQYDDQVLDFAEGRLLLRGRNGAGKSKALEMLLPFLLDGDVRRLDTTGTNRTSLRWLMSEGSRPARTPDPEETGPDLLGGADLADESEPAEDGGPSTRLGYLWVEFTTDRGDRGLDAAARGGTASSLLAAALPAERTDAAPDPDGPPRHLTLGAAVLAAGDVDPRCVFFVTDRRVGHDLELVTDDRPKPVDRLRSELGADNCFTSPVAYRARVMNALFGIDDSVRYRNLVHLLYRLRRPTIGDRLEAGELVSVLSEALPPMDDSVLDEVARNIADLEQARVEKDALSRAGAGVADFLADYRGYLVHALRARAAAVREQLDACASRTAEADRLRAELDELVTAEGRVSEERDQARRTRDTAEADEGTLASAQNGAATATENERRAYDAAVGAYIRAAEAPGSPPNTPNAPRTTPSNASPRTPAPSNAPSTCCARPTPRHPRRRRRRDRPRRPRRRPRHLTPRPRTPRERHPRRPPGPRTGRRTTSRRGDRPRRPARAPRPPPRPAHLRRRPRRPPLRGRRPPHRVHHRRGRHRPPPGRPHQ